MVKRSLVPLLVVLVISGVSLLGGCAEPSGDTNPNGVRNAQGLLVDPHTGIALPGQSSSAGGGGY